MRFPDKMTSRANAWRAGASTAVTHPKRKASSIISQRVIKWVMVSAPRIKARTMETLCVKMSTVRFGNRSTITPPNKDKNMAGSVDAAATSPT